MTNIERLLARQAAWQKDRQQLTWPEKVRLAERIRETVIQLRPGPKPSAVVRKT